MKHILCLVVAPKNDTEAHLHAMLDKHLPETQVAGYAMRPRTIGYYGQQAPPELFKDDTGIIMQHTKNPFPRMTGWKIGGHFASVIETTNDGKAQVVSQDQLYSLAKNSIAARDFKKTFVPNVFVKTDGEWLSHRSNIAWPASEQSELDREKKRIIRAIRDCQPDSLFVVVELSVDVAVERASQIAYPQQ